MRLAFLDTEFMEKDGYVELLSIGIVTETPDGIERFYGVNVTANKDHANEFVRANVLPHLYTSKYGVLPTLGTPPELAQYVESLMPVGADKWEVWAYYADYDWVAFCSLWGMMVNLPEQMPWCCMDIEQEMLMRGIRRNKLPPDDPDEHHALVDAEWTRRAYHAIRPSLR